MRLSVVVPTFDRPEAIRACVDALLAQETGALEIVVVDDGSPVPLAGLPSGRHPVRLIRQDNNGPAAARNRGVAEARGDLVCLTDDDCRPGPGWAGAYLAAAGDAPALWYGRTRNAVRDSLCSTTSQDMADYLVAHGPGAPFAPSNNLCLRRSDYLAIGGFATSFSRAAGEDRAFCAAADRHGLPLRAVPDAILDHHHRLGLRSFWRQHRNYGHGARTWHGQSRAAGRSGFSGPGFYAGLLAAPLRRGVNPATLAGCGLIGLAQIATTQGYLEAARTARETALDRSDI